MGKQVLLMVFVLIVIAGSVFVQLSRKQLKAIDEVVENTFMVQARHISNTFAHTGMRELRDALCTGDIAEFSRSAVNVLNIAGSSAQYIATDLGGNFYELTSTGVINAGDTEYTAVTVVRYRHAEFIPPPETDDGPVILNVGTMNAHFNFSGDSLEVRRLPGDFETSQSQNANKDLAFDNLSKYGDRQILIIADNRIRIQGTINANITVVCPEIWIEDNIYSTKNVNLVSSTGDIVLRDPPSGNSRTLNIAANLYTKGQVRDQSKKVNNINWSNGASAHTRLSNDDLMNIIYPPDEEDDLDDDPDNQIITPPPIDLENLHPKVIFWREDPIQITRF
jgi:hypothetical protein